MFTWFGANPPAMANHIYKDEFHRMAWFIHNAVRDALASGNEEFNAIRLHVIASFEIGSPGTPIGRIGLVDLIVPSGGPVEMPVFRIELLEGTLLTLRYNFHDWVVSVSAPEDIEADFMDLFSPKKQVYVVSWEGPEACLYGPYAENKRQFTLALDGHYRLFAFFWILAHRKHQGSIHELQTLRQRVTKT